MNDYLKFLLEEDQQIEDQGQAEAAQEEGQEPQEEADYMDPQQDPEIQNQEPPVPNSQANSADGLKKLHLFNLAKKLYDYTVILEENLKHVDLGSIDINVVVKLSQLQDNLSRFDAKLRDFIAEVFNKETYEKALYIYLSLRYELLSMTTFLRGILKLEEIEEDLQPANDKAAKNKKV